MPSRIASMPIAIQSRMWRRVYFDARMSSLVMPFMNEIMIVSGPTEGASWSTTAARSGPLTATITRSEGAAISAAF